MKTGHLFAKLAVLFSCSMAFAVNGSQFYNLAVKSTSSGVGTAAQVTRTLYLYQDAAACTVGRAYGEGNCVASVKDTPANLADMLQRNWVDHKDYKAADLMLRSDIDLGEMSATTPTGSCDVNHKPLPFSSGVKMYASNGNTTYSIKNLCYVSNKPMTAPVGLFESVNEVNLADVTLKNVRIIVGGSSNGADYYPVGGLVGVSNLTTIENVKLYDVEIDAPFAGSVVGLLKSSTVKSTSFDDDIFVSNSTAIETGYAGSQLLNELTDHKIFIGGVAGAAIRPERDDASFDNVTVTVKVRNLVKKQKAAVGGIAGLYSSIGESIAGVKVVNKINMENSFGWGWGYTAPSTPIDTIESVISGGSSMGGLFGVLTVFYNEYGTPQPGDIAIKNSSFEGTITGASVAEGGKMNVGGLIGLDSLMKSKSLVIDGGVVKATIEDSVRAVGKYGYHVGGIVGYGSAGSCNAGFDKASDFVSIKNSTASGSISIYGAAASKGESFHMQTFVGGLAGAVCLSHNGDGLKNNSSSMAISIKSRNTVDERADDQKLRFDSLFVGGLAGYFNTGVANPEALLISRSSFTGSIAVDDSLGMAYIGGIVGGMMQRRDDSQGGNGHAVSFSGVKVESNGTLIGYKATAMAKPAGDTKSLAVNIGGICGLCDEIYSLHLSSVKGSIDVSDNFAGDSLLVGGLIGKSYASSVQYVDLQKVFMDGDIAVPTALGEKAKVGFLVGSANFNKPYTIQSVYHYGANDATVTKPFGTLLYMGNEASGNWMTDKNISYVVRNAEVENLDENQKNGTKTLAQMQDDEFLNFLKEPFSTERNPGWNRIVGKNDNLPYVEGENQGCAVGVLTVNFVDANNDLVTPPMCVASGALIQVVDTTKVPVLDSIHCSGWQVLNANGEKEDFDITKPITKNTTLYAKYSLNSYNVVFKKSANPSSVALAGPYSVEHGKSIALPTEYSVEYDSVGYHFVGWHDSVSVDNVTSDLVVIAVYEPNVTIYTYLDKDGKFFAADTVYGNDNRKDQAAPEMEYSDEKYQYVFDGWYAFESDEFAGNVFKAQYKKNLIDYFITFVTMDGDTIDVDTLNYGDEIKYPEAPAKKNMKFVKWEPKSAAVTKNENFVAFYEPVVMPSDTANGADSSKPEIKPIKIALVDTAFLSSGNAFKVKYGVEGLDTSVATVVRLVARLNDEVVLDSILADEVMEGFSAEWQKLFAAAGEYTVQVVVENGGWIDSSYKQKYTVDSVYTVTAKNWQMIALSALETEADGWDNGGVLYWWDETTPIGDYWQYRAFRGDNVDPTRGYWYGSSKGSSLTIQPNANEKVEDIVWKLDNVYSGWNMVANPYGWSIDLSKADDDGAEVSFYQWLPAEGTYGPATKIGPYEAVWAKLKKGSSATVRVPAAPYYGESKSETSAGEKVAALRKSLRKSSSKNWSVVATLADENGRTDFWNIIGAGDKAETTEEPPAGMGDRVNLSVMEGKVALAKSVKTVADEYDWTFSMAASSAREGKLAFDGLEDLNAMGLHLYVTIDGATREVKAGESINVALTKSSKDVGVRVAASAKAMAAANRISGLNMVQSAGELLLHFDASNDLAGASARYTLVGVNGKKIASGSFTANAGSNLKVISAPKAGVYYMHLKVGSQMSSAKILVK